MPGLTDGGRGGELHQEEGRKGQQEDKSDQGRGTRRGTGRSLRPTEAERVTNSRAKAGTRIVKRWGANRLTLECGGGGTQSER